MDLARNERLRIAAEADREAAARYRALADRNPSMRRQYEKAASLAEINAKTNLSCMEAE